MATSLPPSPEPLPRRTTPLAVMLRVPVARYCPGARSTAPRDPFISGRRATASSAAWMTAVSSPPDGLTISTAGTFGSATPPPM
jgi:hypothetical protein